MMALPEERGQPRARALHKQNTGCCWGTATKPPPARRLLLTLLRSGFGAGDRHGRRSLHCKGPCCLIYLASLVH